MKKMLRYLLMTVMALCFSLPCLSAEAATVALLPLINNARNYEEANQIFYKEAIAAMNSQKGFMMVENDKLAAAIDAANVGNKVPGENVLVKVAKDGDVDIAIAIQLDKIEEETLFSSEENKIKISILGRTTSYNALTGEFRNRKINHEVLIPEVFSSRWNVSNEEWGKVVRTEIKKALAAKK